jgi:hypothetical protein
MFFLTRNRVLAGVFFSIAAAGSPAAWLSAAEKPAEEQKPVQITLYPAPEPKPALKFQLLPPLTERRPGNAAVVWNKIFAGRPDFIEKFQCEDPCLWESITKWMEIPLGTPQEKEARAKMEKELREKLSPEDWKFLLAPPGTSSGCFSEMERAARLESCDWQLPLHEGGFIMMFLPELQQTRMYGRLLSAKAHLEIAEGKYEQAVRTLQTGFALTRQDAQGPTIIHSLVGTSLAETMMFVEIRQLIQQPDAPNLYWALSTLPRPLIDYQSGFEGEYHCLYLTFPELQDLEQKNYSPEKWRELLLKVKDLLHLSGDNPSEPTEKEITDQIYPRAKRYLIEMGRTVAEVEAMPMAQVVLLASMQVYNEIRDDLMKWNFLQYLERGENRQQAENELMKAARAREFLPIATQMLPALSPAKNAETRIQWNLAMLRIFEAMRLYAANHEGRWPDRLNDVKEVPIPLNPFDGKPFIYHRDGEKAVLTSEAGPPNTPWRHEITFGRKEK